MTRFRCQIALVFLAIFAFCTLAPSFAQAQTAATPPLPAAPYIPLVGLPPAGEDWPTAHFYLLTPAGTAAKSRGCPFETYPELFDAWREGRVIASAEAYTDPQGSGLTDKERESYAAITSADTQDIKALTDKDGCPYVKKGYSAIFMKSCAGFYRTIPALANENGDTNSDIISCCHLPPDGSRVACENAQKQKAMEMKVFKIMGGKRLCQPTEGMSKEDFDKCAAQKAEKMNSIQQCAMDSYMRIGAKFNAGKLKACINAVKKYIKRYADKTIKEYGFEMGDGIVTTLSDINVHVGTSSGGNFISKPIGAAAKGAKGAIRWAGVAYEVANTINDLINSCTNINTGFTDLKSWATQQLNNVVCKGIIQLIERQLTQCIRVHIDSSGPLFSLPTFNFVTQCPITMNLNARIGHGGFFCGSFTSVRNPIAGSTGTNGNTMFYGGHSYSLLGSDGGLRGLFTGACYKESTARADKGGAPLTGRINANGTLGNVNSVEFTPGIDCVKTPSADGSHDGLNPVITSAYSGTKYLPTAPVPATPNASGWSVSKIHDEFTVSGVGGSVPVVVSRCDKYKNGRSIRTEYVWGDGSACIEGLEGFKIAVSGKKYEARTTCYPDGGYLPKVMGSIPIACLYPQEPPLFNADGTFSAVTQPCLKADLTDLDSTKITGAADSPCKEPKFDIYAKKDAAGVPAKDSQLVEYERLYPKPTGGISVKPKGPSDYASCKDFQTASEDTTCCDPQYQDCRKMPLSVPICACDEGDRDNKVVLDGTTNKPTGACTKGGTPTCCNQGINGKGAGGCGTEYYKFAPNPPDRPAPYYPDVTETLGVAGELLTRGRTHTPTMRNCPIAQQTCIPRTNPDGTPKNVPRVLSPYAYLFVEADVSFVDGSGVTQQCCTSKWCNVCPAEYGAAQALGKGGAFIAGGGTNTWVWDGDGNVPVPPPPAGAMSYKAVNNAENKQLFRLGWPYFEHYDKATNKRRFSYGVHAWMPIWEAVYADRKASHEFGLDTGDDRDDNDDLWYNSFPSMFAWKWFHGLFDYKPVAMTGQDVAPTAWNEYGYWPGSKGIAKAITFSIAKSLQMPPLEYDYRVDSSGNKILMDCDADLMATNSYNDFTSYWQSRTDKAWLTISQCPEDGGAGPFILPKNIMDKAPDELIGIGGVTYKSQLEELVRPCPTYGRIWANMKLHTWKQDMSMMQDGVMGLLAPEDDDMMSFKLYGAITEPTEYPIDYLNKELAQTARASGKDFVVVDICDNVIKQCPIDTGDGGSGGLDPTHANAAGLGNNGGGLGLNGSNPLTAGDLNNGNDNPGTRTGITRNGPCGDGMDRADCDPTIVGGIGNDHDNDDDGSGDDDNGEYGNGGGGSGRKNRKNNLDDGDGGLTVNGAVIGGVKHPKTGGGGATEVPSLESQDGGGSLFDKLF